MPRAPRWLALAALCAPAAPAQTWSRTYPLPGDDGLTGALEAPDGSLLAIGFASDGGRVARLGADGSVLWARLLPGVDRVLRGHEVCANGDVVVCGQDGPGALLARLDPAGNPLWEQRLPFHWSGGEESLLFAFADVEEAANGDLVVAGQVLFEPDGEPSGLLLRFDAAGTLLWSKGATYGWLSDVEELASGELALVGSLYWSGLVYLHTQADGTMLRARRLPPQGGTRGELALAAGDTAYVVSGCHTCNYYLAEEVDPDGVHAPTAPCQVTKLATDGDVLWRRSYGAAPDSAIDVAATPDGGAVVLGETRALGGDRDLRLFRIDADGALLWQRAYGGPGEERASSVAALADGGFVLTGRTESGGEMDGLVLRVDAMGEIATCPTTLTWRPQALLPGLGKDLVGDLWGLTVALEPASLADADALPGPLATCLGMPEVGLAFCSPAVANSSGLPAESHAVGSSEVGANDVALVAVQAPAGTFGYFLAGLGTAVFVPPGSEGRLCLGGSAIFRFTTPLSVTDADGQMSRAIDVTDIPGHGAVLPGETWNFQAWFRDANPLPTSNFTDASAVTFH